MTVNHISGVGVNVQGGAPSISFSTIYAMLFRCCVRVRNP